LDGQADTVHLMEMSEEEFQALYGTWEPLSLLEVRDLMGPLTWWVVGGWALELATGVSRHHEDTDVAVPRHDLPRVAAHLTGHHAPHHLWAAQHGTLTPLARLDPFPADHEQLWVRRNAQSPWVLDLLLTPVDGDVYVYKKDHRVRLPMSEAVVTTDGIPHLAAHVALLHKAHLGRPKDDVDLAAALPTLTREERRWLTDAVRLAVPDSRWNATLRQD
jgi:hypothetical protein